MGASLIGTFWNDPPRFLHGGGGGKNAILAKFSTRIQNGGSLLRNGTKYEKLKNGYETISKPNLAGGRLNNNGERLSHTHMG